MKAIILSAALLLPIAGFGVAAPPCDGNVTAVGPLYIDDRDFFGGDGLWIYLESNGVAGLQRGGQSIILGSLDQEFAECAVPNPDTLIF